MVERVDTGVRIDNRFEIKIHGLHCSMITLYKHQTLQRQIHFRFRSQLNFDHQKNFSSIGTEIGAMKCE